MALAVVLALTVTLAAQGCTEGPDSASKSDKADTAPSSPASTPTPSSVSNAKDPKKSTEVADDILIEYRREGGIAGFQDHIIIGPDGSGTYSGRSGGHEFLLDKSELAATETALKSANDAPAAKKEDHPDAMFSSFTFRGQAKVMPSEVSELMFRIIAEGNAPTQGGE